MRPRPQPQDLNGWPARRLARRADSRPHARRSVAFPAVGSLVALNGQRFVAGLIDAAPLVFAVAEGVSATKPHSPPAPDALVGVAGP